MAVRRIPDAPTSWDSVYQSGVYKPDSDSSMVDWMSASFDFSKKPVILDLGCGHGKTAIELADKGAVVHVCDIAESPLENLRKEPRLASVKQCSADDLSAYPDGMFDGVLSKGVLQYLDLDGILKAFVEVNRVLKPGGRFFCNLPTTEDGRTQVVYNTPDANLSLTFLSPDDVCALHTRTGLRLNMLARRPDIEPASPTKQYWYVYAAKPLR